MVVEEVQRVMMAEQALLGRRGRLVLLSDL